MALASNRATGAWAAAAGRHAPRGEVRVPRVLATAGTAARVPGGRR
jgi:hypothetical protein